MQVKVSFFLKFSKTFFINILDKENEWEHPDFDNNIFKQPLLAKISVLYR